MRVPAAAWRRPHVNYQVDASADEQGAQPVLTGCAMPDGDQRGRPARQL